MEHLIKQKKDVKLRACFCKSESLRTYSVLNETGSWTFPALLASSDSCTFPWVPPPPGTVAISLHLGSPASHAPTQTLPQQPGSHRAPRVARTPSPCPCFLLPGSPSHLAASPHFLERRGQFRSHLQDLSSPRRFLLLAILLCMQSHSN